MSRYKERHTAKVTALLQSPLGIIGLFTFRKYID